ncbi:MULTISPECIES: fumarylacetoacetate hydrolase family protein [Mesorhizobium]|uniref:fumarylacetoacetate hydrolase family protein n=1 Tax=Mesorhizobium TaxID=68287 RepID=UPI0010A96329|nr:MULTISPECIES: fumarylacetoacetate hydrolase family protein [Mesorhizobium]
MKLGSVKKNVAQVLVVASTREGIFVELGVVLRQIAQREVANAVDSFGLAAFIKACGEDVALLAATAAAVDAQKELATIDLNDVQWMPPLANPKIVCVANNNTAFAKDIVKGPKNPALFNKPSSALIGLGQAIELRPDHGITYPEPELAVVVSRKLKNASVEEASAAIFGYTIHNDVTSATMREEDTFHYREATIAENGSFKIVESYASYPGRYKGADTFAPMGPWIVTADEIPDPHSLAVECWMGSELAYADNTRNLTHSSKEVLSFASHYQTINPGDVISMGTASDPAGETGDKPQVATDMNRGCTSVTVKIEKIGALTNGVVRL